MKKYIPYAIAVIILLFAAIVSLACGVATTLPTAAPVKSHSITTAPQTATESPTRQFYVTAETLYVRKAAGMSAAVIGEPLKYGAQVVIVGTPIATADGAEWVEVATAENGGVIGWVNVRYLEVR